MLPASATKFDDNLTDDLINYGLGLLDLALELREQQEMDPFLTQALLRAGEAIEVATHHGDSSRIDRGFLRVTSAAAFSLARYSARAYSMLTTAFAGLNLSPPEQALGLLLKSNIGELESYAASWLIQFWKRVEDPGGLDDDSASTWSDGLSEFLAAEIIAAILTYCMAVRRGDSAAIGVVTERLSVCVDASLQGDYPSLWWVSRLAHAVIGDHWDRTLFRALDDGPDGSPLWKQLARDYVEVLMSRPTAEVELWPSQIESVAKTLQNDQSFCVTLPTSAGKTRIAEIAILRTLASKRRALYVTPLRALSAQIEHTLARTFVPLGFRVSALYGASVVSGLDIDSLKRCDIAIATPEKLDFATRNNPGVLDDVGIIVLDEGHLIGSGQSGRGTRYELLTQRLLKRSDSGSRRILCLSAMFPSDDSMTDFNSWITRSEDEPVRSNWRPTRQQFGTIVLSAQKGRLDLRVGNEQPYVKDFVDPKSGQLPWLKSTSGSDATNFSLAVAGRLLLGGHQVLVYCPERRRVGQFAKRVSELVADGGSLPDGCGPLGAETRSLLSEWLGENHPVSKCLEAGVAVHHAHLPRQILSEIERAIGNRQCSVVVASPTLSQGLNLPCSALVVTSVRRGGKLLPADEFANVVGRAGRAFVDIDGLIVHPVFSGSAYSIREWWKLVGSIGQRTFESSVLTLCGQLADVVARHLQMNPAQITEDILNSVSIWDQPPDNLVEEVREWEGSVLQLDLAIISMAENLDVDLGELAAAIDTALHGSFFEKRLRRLPEGQESVLSLVKNRAQWLWSKTTANQRYALAATGMGWGVGRWLAQESEGLVQLLINAESAATNGDPATINFIEGFAEKVFTQHPFIPLKLANSWKDDLRWWLGGSTERALSQELEEERYDFVNDACLHKLTWAAEVVRSWAVSTGVPQADGLEGLISLLLQAGVPDLSMAMLVRTGLRSREAAVSVVNRGVRFGSQEDMMIWLSSDEAERLTALDDYPTPRSMPLWREFLTEVEDPRIGRWNRWDETVNVEWETSRPIEPGEPLILVSVGEERLFVADDGKVIGRATNATPLTEGMCIAEAASVGGVVLHCFGRRRSRRRH